MLVRQAFGGSPAGWSLLNEQAANRYLPSWIRLFVRRKRHRCRHAIGAGLPGPRRLERTFSWISRCCGLARPVVGFRSDRAARRHHNRHEAGRAERPAAGLNRRLQRLSPVNARNHLSPAGTAAWGFFFTYAAVRSGQIPAFPLQARISRSPPGHRRRGLSHSVHSPAYFHARRGKWGSKVSMRVRSNSTFVRCCVGKWGS